MLDVIGNAVISTFDISSPDTFRLISSLMIVYVVTATPLVAWVAYDLLRKKPQNIQGKEQEKPAKPAVNISATASSADEVMQLIKDRRSVFPKDYTGQLVDRATIEKILEAANWAPTHGKTEPWRFVVLSPTAFTEMMWITQKVLERTVSAEELQKKRKKMESKADDYKKATFIAICSKRQANPSKLQPEWEELAATSCAVQNMQLMTHALGAAAYWSSWQGQAVCNSPEFKEYLGLDSEDSCLGFFILGNSDAGASYRSKRGSMADKVQWK